MPLLHVVLHQPDIPQNTGNIGRTCVAVGAKLWLIRPLGFQLDEKHLRRAGMDYWDQLDWEAVDSWTEFRAKVPQGTVWCIENPAQKRLWDATFVPGDILVFGAKPGDSRPLSSRNSAPQPFNCRCGPKSAASILPAPSIRPSTKPYGNSAELSRANSRLNAFASVTNQRGASPCQEVGV